MPSIRSGHDPKSPTFLATVSSWAIQRQNDVRQVSATGRRASLRGWFQQRSAGSTLVPGIRDSTWIHVKSTAVRRSTPNRVARRRGIPSILSTRVTNTFSSRREGRGLQRRQHGEGSSGTIPR
jgi:hypothetical protein